VFAAVAREVAQLLRVDHAHVGRYEPGRALTFLAAFGDTMTTSTETIATNTERMVKLDDAWNARDWDTFDAYHSAL
jgi:hypothetical protein